MSFRLCAVVLCSGLGHTVATGCGCVRVPAFTLMSERVDVVSLFYVAVLYDGLGLAVANGMRCVRVPAFTLTSERAESG